MISSLSAARSTRAGAYSVRCRAPAPGRVEGGAGDCGACDDVRAAAAALPERRGDRLDSVGSVELQREHLPAGERLAVDGRRADQALGLADPGAVVDSALVLHEQ